MSALQEKLDPDEAMLVYQIANQKALDGQSIGGSWVLLLTQNSAEPIKLDLQRSELSDSVSIVRDMARYDNSAMPLAVQGLAEKLLQPVTSKLSHKVRNLIIVADGPLHALPFFSIDSNYNYTITPSTAVWLRTRRPQSELQRVPTGISVVDPTRINTRNQKDKTSRSANRDANVDVSLPLHEGRRESKAIQRSLNSDFRTLQGAAATPQRLIQAWKPDDNILHISAHAQVDTEVPEKSKILLSNVHAQEQGNLSIDEIYSFPLQNDVVVLAGCSTGWGSWIAGEGILSLARAFQIAGASTVVASLWPIRDDEAADFFEEFYENLGEGQPVALALSNAQKTLRNRGYPSQAYEGYIVLGDGRVRFVAQNPKTQWLRWLIASLALLPMGLLLGFKWSKKNNRGKKNNEVA